MSEEQVAEVSEAEVTQSVASPEDWRTSVPEEIRGHKSLEHISDVGALAKSYVNAQSMIGADKVAIPGKHATSEDWDEVYRRLGRPDTPDAYELVNEVPDGVAADDDLVGWFRGAAHEVGLTEAQAQKLLAGYNEMLGSSVAMSEGQRQQTVSETAIELQKEYGAAFQDRMDNANALMDEFAVEGLTELEMADGTFLGDNPDIVRMMVNISEFINTKIGEDSLEGMKTSGQMTPDDVREKLSQITANGSPYWDQKHPEHDYAVSEALRLREMSGE